MEKAILEIDVPNSCNECMFSITPDFTSCSDYFCIFIRDETIKYTRKRAPFCPLKIIPVESLCPKCNTVV